MVRRSKWKSTLIIILVMILELVAVASAYEGSNVFFGSRINSDYSQMHRAWRLRGRGIRNGSGRRQNGHKRNRLSWDRDEVRGDRFRPNKRVNNPGRVNSEALFPVTSVEECCPTVTHLVEPLSGKNRTGDYVELYRHEKLVQRFYEVSCKPEIVNKPCKFLDGRHSRFSTCSQKYSYSYALVTNQNYDPKEEEQPSYLDYISIRSGCACEVTATRRKKRQRGL